MKNFKKVISAVIALAMMVSSFATVSASKFTDVADTASYAEAIEILTSLGIVSGYAEEDGSFTFKPEGTITRAEAATMIVGALNMTEDAKASAGTSQFADVNTQAAWASGYINVGVAQGFINGMDATTFAPQENVTYAQMCVMLTSIAGYGEYAAASSTGSWSSGYTSMAASTGINKGVSVGDSTPLTRGQVAQMIYNTLVTPMLGVAEYSLTGNTYSQLDGKKDREFKTLLSDKFDGYVATVEIVATPVSADLENDKVTFEFEKADYWYDMDADDIKAAVAANTPETVYFAEGVDVNNNLHQIGKAVFVENEDEDAVMIYFAATGKVDTKEVEAEDYVLQANLGDANKAVVTGKVRFGGTYYKLKTTAIEAEGTTTVDGVVFADGETYYKPTVAVYVNGKAVTAPTTMTGVETYLANAVDTVTMIKNTDGVYDKIFVDYYQIAEVTSVDYDNSETAITLKGMVAGIGETPIDEIVITDEAIEDKDVVVTVTKNGAAAELSSIVKGDVLAIAVTEYKSTIGDKGTIKIIATDETVEGRITAKDDVDNTYTIDGKEYETIGLVSLSLRDTIIGKLDPFGRIFSKELDGTSEKYAIALDFTNSGDSLKMLLTDGTVKTYPIENSISFDDDALDAKTSAAQRIIKYTLKNSTGELKTAAFVTPDAFTAEEYNTKTNKIDSSEITATTPIFDVEDIETLSEVKTASNYKTFAQSNFVGGVEYDGYKVTADSGRYTVMVLLTAKGKEFGTEARFAVVKKEATEHETDDGDLLYKVGALVDGKDSELYFETDAKLYNDTTQVAATAEGLAKGDVIYYSTNGEGNVKVAYLVKDGDVFNGFTAIPAAKRPTGLDGWTASLENAAKNDIQLVKAAVVAVESGYITLAEAGTAATKIDTNVTLEYADLTDDGEDNPTTNYGVKDFSISDGTLAYRYRANDSQATNEAAKYAKTNAASIKASKLVDGDDDGIITGTSASDLTIVYAMIVEGEVVCIYAVER